MRIHPPSWLPFENFPNQVSYLTHRHTRLWTRIFSQNLSTTRPSTSSLSPPPPEGKYILLNRLNKIVFALRDSPKQSGRRQEESSMDDWLMQCETITAVEWSKTEFVVNWMPKKKRTHTNTGTLLLAARVKSLLATPAIWHCHRINQNAKHYFGTGKHKTEKQEK